MLYFPACYNLKFVVKAIESCCNITAVLLGQTFLKKGSSPAPFPKTFVLFFLMGKSPLEKIIRGFSEESLRDNTFLKKLPSIILLLYNSKL